MNASSSRDRPRRRSASGTSRSSSGGRGGRRDDGGAAEELAAPLQKVLRRLPEAQRRVLEYRMGLVDGHPHDLADTARALGMTQYEVRDIEKRAFEHIREVVPLDRLHKLLGS